MNDRPATDLDSFESALLVELQDVRGTLGTAAGQHSPPWRQPRPAHRKRWVVAAAVVGAVFVVLPLAAMTLRIDWPRFVPLVTSEGARAALLLSLRTSVSATILCVLFGVPLALVLARTSFPGRRLVRSLVLLPLVLPPVVGGIALLYTFGRRGLLGQSLQVLGVQIAFTTTAVVLAQTFVSLPFLVVALAIEIGHAHAAKAQDGNGEAGAAELAGFHRGVVE